MPSHLKNIQRRPARSGRGITVTIALLALAACTSGDSVTQPTVRSDMPWELQLNHEAIVMAIGDEVQLQATALKLDGTPLTGLAAATYTTSDTSVKVDASGRLTATQPRANVLVVGKIQNVEDNWTVADTVRVMVVAEEFDFATYAMQTNKPAVIPANKVHDGGNTNRLRYDARLYDAAGNQVVDAEGDPILPLTYYKASVPKNVYDISNPWSPMGTARNLGNVTVRGTSHIFGQDYEDEVTFRITYPDSAVLQIYRVSNLMNPSPSMMSQTDLTILRGGKVGFRSSNPTEQVDIVFADAANVIGGNIPVVPNSPTIRIVTFPNVGQYTYTSSKGFGGTITVVDP